MADWGKIESRGDVEDRRGSRSIVGIGGGIGLGGLGLLLVLNLLTGGNISDVLTQIDPNAVVQQQTQDTTQYEGLDSYEVFVSTVLGSANDMWKQQINTYTEPKLVLFRDYTQSACGGASLDVGPHYCPLDQTIYLDETFFDELTSRFGAKGGDVAQAYVIAHEVGHHAQEELGTLARARTDTDSIKVELQADCFAGMWAHSIKDRGVFEVGEIAEAMDAAAAVGDDRIQKKVTGYVNPETWTHGSSAQRVRSFTIGYEKGTLDACNTFK